MRFEPGMPSPSMLVSVSALIVAMSGTSYAAVTLQRNSVGTSQLKANAVTTAKVRDGSLLRADFKPGQLVAGAAGQKGDTGSPGPAGQNGKNGTDATNGAAGTPATKLWAVVNQDGTLARGSGVVSVNHPAGTGVYRVRFDRSVAACSWVASLGSPGAYSGGDGFITTGIDFVIPVSFPLTPVNDTLLVITANTAAATSARPFHLAVFC